MARERPGVGTEIASLIGSLVLCLGLLGPASTLADGTGETGIASWYGGWHHGRQMANGRRFDQWGSSAAHKTLPLGTRVRVRNLENGRTAVVVIEDRGPYIRGRIIDVSRGTAELLDMRQAGVARVEIRVLPPSPTPR